MSESPLSTFNYLAWTGNGWPRVTQSMRMATQWLTLLVGFTIPLAASPAEIFTTSLMVTWLLSGDWKQKTAAVRGNPIALMALAMFGVLLVGVYYSSAGWLGSFKCLLKYREFLYIPMLLPIFQDAKLRQLALQAFVAGMIVLVGLSYFEWMTGLDICLPSAPTDNRARYDYVTFKDRIVHSVMAAFLIYIAAWKVTEPDTRKWFWWGFMALALGNILWLLQGRTGYVVLGSLTVLFMSQYFGRRGIVYAATLLTLIAAFGCLFIPSVQYRVEFTLQQLESHFGPERKSYWDGRLEFYSNTLTLIGRHPFFGTGTGSFEREYGELARVQGLAATVDPHNEYLILAVQTGLFGVGVFLTLLIMHARMSSRLPLQEKRMAHGALLVTAVGCLFNSLILGHTGGLYFSYFSALSFAALDTKQPAIPTTQTSRPILDEQTIAQRKAA